MHLNAAHAMPIGTLLNAKPYEFPGDPKDHRRFTFEAAYDTVFDNVEHEGPPANGTPIQGESLPRYRGAHALGNLDLGGGVTLTAGLWDRDMANKRDRYQVQSVQAAIQYTLPYQWNGNRMALRFGYWRNDTDQLGKNSFTRIDDYKITSLAIVNPRDENLQFNFISTRELGRGFNASGYLGVGVSQIGYDRIEGVLRDKKNCDYRFDLERNSGVVTQMGRCGAIKSLQIEMPTETSIVSNIGINPREALEYDAVYYQAGIGMGYNTRRWETSVGYEIRQYHRPGIDAQVTRNGDTPYELNHNLTLDVGYGIGRATQLFGRAEYESSRLLSSVPFAYNAFTADRFTQPGLYFSFGLRMGF
ncbi:MAG: hypothetical protein ACFCUJ_02035 [Thiotrichales bacterium]